MIRALPLPVRNGVIVLEGYGVRLYVERKHLVLEDGICEDRRWARIVKASFRAHRIKRVVILGHSGYITLEALRWLHDVGCGVVQVDRDGQIILASGPVGLDDARLRRAQALAATNGVGVRIGRDLVTRKLADQLTLLERLPGGDGARGEILEALDCLEEAKNPEGLRLLEARAASAYWKAWEEVPVQFVRKDLRKLPDHWKRFGSRGSPLANGPRLASNPANAVLNYLYAVLETEARIALVAMGLDPGIGFLHTDQPSRDSLALDVMEAVRPEVDSYLLEMLVNQVFRAQDFFETRGGICRVLPPLTRVLCATSLRWAGRIAPVVEWLVKELAKTLSSRVRSIPTPLTQSHRSSGRDHIRKRPRKEPATPSYDFLPFCRMCGVELPDSGRMYCDRCLPKHQKQTLQRFQNSGPRALQNLMAQGCDPSHGGEAARRRGASIARSNREAAAWNRERYRPDPEEFRRTILPGLQSVSLGMMMKATGLSLRYCSLIRRGLNVPHPRHWEMLARLINPDT